MEPITYQDLLTALSELTPEQLQMNATVYIAVLDEAYPIYNTFLVSELRGNPLSDIFEENQPVLTTFSVP